MIFNTSLIQHLIDKPYKFIMFVAVLTLISSFQYSLLNIDVNDLRFTSLLILIYCIAAWIYDNHTFMSLKEDINNEFYGTEEAEFQYKKTIEWVNIIVFLLSTITIIVTF